MKLELNLESFDKGLEVLSKEYRIFAPKAFPQRGTYSDTDVVKYSVVSSTLLRANSESLQSMIGRLLYSLGLVT